MRRRGADRVDDSVKAVVGSAPEEREGEVHELGLDAPQPRQLGEHSERPRGNVVRQRECDEEAHERQATSDVRLAECVGLKAGGVGLVSDEQCEERDAERE